MAKDGTVRGGAKPGLGRPKKPLVEKIAAGKAEKEYVLPTPEVLSVDEDIPEMKDYMIAEQKNGEKLCTEEVFRETYLWLKSCNCERLVPRQLLDQYAMDVARWVQCQKAINTFGLLAPHPTTKVAIASPYVSMARDIEKQVTSDWFQIYQIVRDNATVAFGSGAPIHDDMMELLLTGRA